MQKDRQIHIIAGANGAGKSSHARITLLPQFLQSNEFVNADEIAKMLSPENPEESALAAGRLMLKRMKFLVSEGLNFAFETTLSAKTYLKFIEKAHLKGYKINLIFLKLQNPQLARQRVLLRVSKGGHDIDPATIDRRFQRGLANLQDYIKIADTAAIYEASGLELIEIAKKSNDEIIVMNQNLWNEIYAK